MRKIIFLLFIFLIVVFTRFYNIDKTSRFIWDESSDLVNIHRIWVDKDITLIGPISEDGNKVFGSLTYYLLLPFAILFDFSPISTTIGASFYGVVICLLLIYLSYKIKGKLEILPILLSIFWTAILIPSRWAWNPNFMLLWSTLAIIIFLSNLKFKYFLIGFLLSINIHHHYLGFYVLSAFGLVILFQSLIQKKYLNFIQYVLGGILPIIPFVLFDLTHKPGLFLTRILYFNYLNSDTNIFLKIGSGNLLFLATLIPIIYYDVKNKYTNTTYIFIFLFSSIVILFTTQFYPHYLLAGIPFLFAYLLLKRKGFMSFYSNLLIVSLILLSFSNLKNTLNNITWENDIRTITKISKTLDEQIDKHELKNVNIAVLQSPDTNIYGRRFRDLLLINNKVLLSKYEYGITDNLFVLSYSDLDKVRNDQAYEIRRFNKGKLINMWSFEDSNWKLYLLDRNK